MSTGDIWIETRLAGGPLDGTVVRATTEIDAWRFDCGADNRPPMRMPPDDEIVRAAGRRIARYVRSPLRPDVLEFDGMES
jgi:hypothetical protein